MRFNGFDFLRVCCVFAVVWIHGSDTSILAKRLTGLTGFAVPAFILMSFFLLQRSVLTHAMLTWRYVLFQRMKRLLPAYAVWSLLYLAVRLFKHAMTGEQLLSVGEWGVALLTGGASYQLYFVAAVIYWVILFLPLLVWRSPSDLLPTVLLLLLSAICFGFGLHFKAQIEFTPRMFLWAQMLGLTGYVPLAMALARLWVLYGDRVQSSRWTHWFGLFLGGLGVGWMVCRVPFGKTIVPPLSLFLFGLFVSIRKPSFFVTRLSRLSYGIFLVHGFFIEGFQMAAYRMNWPLEHFVPTLLLILFSFACSYLCCELIMRFKKLRWLVV